MFHQLFKIPVALAALLCFSGVTGAKAQPLPAEKTRVLTIEEVVQMALTNNLDILISRLNPVIDQFALNGLYGAYEPSFSMSAVHNYNDLPAGIFPQAGLFFGATVENIDSYAPGLTGTLPTGLTYNFTGPISRQNITEFGGDRARLFKRSGGHSEPAVVEEPVDRQRALSDSGGQKDPQDRSTSPAPSDHDGD